MTSGFNRAIDSPVVHPVGIVGSETTADELHACPHCEKQFFRQCDLNKHSKAHTRPFKCPIPTCRYHSFGWPTAKELERHVNDKHCNSPRIYPCHFQPCSYRSKRQSNCKQHMEKAHGYNYVRSRAHARRFPDDNDRSGSEMSSLDLGLGLGLSMSLNRLEPGESHLLPSDRDFVIFPPNELDESAASDQDDASFYTGPETPIGQVPRVYVPWTSPANPLRETATLPDNFSHAYNATPEGPTNFGREDGSSKPINPTPSPTVVSTYVPSRGMSCDRYLTPGGFVPRGTRPGSVSAYSNPPGASTPSKQGLGSRFPSPPISPGLRQAPPLLSLPKRRFDHRNEDDEDSDDEEDGDAPPPPRKQSRSSPSQDLDFSDNAMPDIFHHAHPHIYNMDWGRKYAACHTSHSNISALIRHLKRPAHALEVTSRFVSSFSLDDEACRHPRTGVCRRCWTSFCDRAVFEEHVSRACDKVSKGKKEKWRILFNALTPMVDGGRETDESGRTAGRADQDDTQQLTSSQSLQHRPRRHDPAEGASLASSDLESLPITAASPTAIDLGSQTQARSPANGAAFVSMERNLRNCTLAYTLGQASPGTGGELGFPVFTTLPDFQDNAPSGSSPVRAQQQQQQQQQPQRAALADRENPPGHIGSRSINFDHQVFVRELPQTSTAAQRAGTTARPASAWLQPRHVPATSSVDDMNSLLPPTGTYDAGLHSVPDSAYCSAPSLLNPSYALGLRGGGGAGASLGTYPDVVMPAAFPRRHRGDQEQPQLSPLSTVSSAGAGGVDAAGAVSGVDASCHEPLLQYAPSAAGADDATMWDDHLVDAFAGAAADEFNSLIDYHQDFGELAFGSPHSSALENYHFPMEG